MYCTSESLCNTRLLYRQVKREHLRNGGRGQATAAENEGVMGGVSEGNMGKWVGRSMCEEACV